MLTIKCNMCYTRLIQMMMQTKKYTEAISETKFKAPNLSDEGFNGYIETEVEFEVKDIQVFADLYEYVVVTSEFYQEIRNG